MALQISMNSTTSTRLSPPSYLRPTKAFGEFTLGQAGSFACPDHHVAKRGLPCRMDGFVEFARANSHRRGRLILRSDYLTNLNRFHDVDTPFSAFVFGDERLRPTKAFGEFMLG